MKKLRPVDNESAATVLEQSRFDVQLALSVFLEISKQKNVSVAKFSGPRFSSPSSSCGSQRTKLSVHNSSRDAGLFSRSSRIFGSIDFEKKN